MRSLKKCYGLLLVLFIMLGLSLSVFSDVNALKHDYKGISFLVPQFPNKFVNVNGRKVIDFNYNYTGAFGEFYIPDSRFYLLVSGDSNFDYSSYKLKHNLSYMNMDYNNSNCNYSSISPILNSNITATQAVFTVNSANQYTGFNYFLKNIKGFDYNTSASLSSHCKHREKFGSDNQPNFNSSSLPNVTTLTCGLENGAVCGGLWSVRNYVSSQMLPDYWYTTDGFWIHSKAINSSNGITYNHSFSFSDMLNQPVKTLNRLYLPLFSFDDYWINASNFYDNRPIAWRGSFEFDSPAEFLDSQDGFFRIALYSDSATQYLPCTGNYISLDFNNTYRLDYECSGNLQYNSAYMYPVLELSAGSADYYFKTDGDWRFGSQFLITDNDETPGESFNSDLHGVNVLGSASNDFSEDNISWFDSLLGLFSFDIINPFRPLFDMFSENPCVQIPIIAGMLKAESTEYCAWFPSEVRNIVTPVMSMASVMLVFGFFIRWLKGSSGDVIEQDRGVYF